jgi:hypothetical protein
MNLNFADVQTKKFTFDNANNFFKEELITARLNKSNKEH